MLALALALAAGALGCHTFPDDPNATRWPTPPPQPPLTFVSGRVFLQGTATPIAGVTVSAGSTSSVTDATGYYALDGQRLIQTLMVAAKEGYDTTRVSLQLFGGNQTFNMSIRPQQ